MMPLSEQLNYVTVRVECENSSGELSTGTGYFFAFLTPNDDRIVGIVTNKHVVDGMSIGKFALTLRKEDGCPDIGNYEVLTLPKLQQFCLYHPADDIDLAVIPVGFLFGESGNHASKYYYIALDESLIPSPDDMSQYLTVEDIIMVGYPNGIWDERNNLPIFRKGITATHPGIKLNGRPEFLIDAACFPGSSGSPVFLLNQGSYVSRDGSLAIGNRTAFFGTLWGGPMATANGDIRVVDIPTSTRTIALSRIPSNLGYVLQADQLYIFNTIIEDFVGSVISDIKQSDISVNTGRNSPCPCGSGRKFKQCCGKL